MLLGAGVKPTVVYHGDCPDGAGAALAAWLRFGDAATYEAGRYGEDATPAGDVFLLDFSWSRWDVRTKGGCSEGGDAMGVNAMLWMGVGRELTQAEIDGFNAQQRARRAYGDRLGAFSVGQIRGRADTSVSWDGANWSPGGESVEGCVDGEPVYCVTTGLMRYAAPGEHGRGETQETIADIADEIRAAFPGSRVWYGCDSAYYGNLMTDVMMAQLRDGAAMDG